MASANYLFRDSLIFISSLLLAPQAIRAQDSAISFGPQFSYIFGTPLDIERSSINTLGSNGLGTSYAHTFGAGAEVRFPSVLYPEIGLSLIAHYSWSTGEFTSNPYTSSDNGSSISGTQQFHLSSHYQTASVTGLLAYHLSDSWDAGLGAGLSYRVADALIDWREILSPDGATFSSNGSTRDTVATGRAISSNPLRIAIPIFLGYSVPVANGVTLTSRLFGATDLGELFSGYTSESLSGGISISVLFDPNRRDVPRTSFTPARNVSQPETGRAQHVPTDSAARPPPRMPNTIHAAIHLEINGVAARVARVREVDTLIEQFTAVSRAVRIPNAESRLVRSYIVPDLSVSRYVESEAGIRSWNIRISQGERILGEYSNLDSTQPSAMNASIDLNNGGSPAPVIAELRVIDERGASRFASDTLDILPDTAEGSARIHRQDYFFLSPATSNLRSQDSLLLRCLVSSLDTSGTLTIAPFGMDCGGADSLSTTVLSAIRTARAHPSVIRLLREPLRSDAERSGECGIHILYVRKGK